MPNNLYKKILIAFIIPIFILISAWVTWTTKNVFSAQRTEVVLENHKKEASKEQTYVRDQFQNLNGKIDGLDEKVDSNQEKNYDLLLDIQQQITGEIRND